MKNLIMITSVINISKDPLDYSNIRSVYTPEERYDQTLNTIKSCSKIKSKEILFIETSNLSKEKEDEIKKLVDYYYNFSDSEVIKKATNGRYKGIAESTQIYEGLKMVDMYKYENIIKISGRYLFSDDFKYSDYDNSENIFKEGPNKTALATVMYKINKKDFKLYNETIEFCKTNSGMLEKNYIKFFSNKYITLPKIGVSGNVSVDGNPIDW